MQTRYVQAIKNKHFRKQGNFQVLSVLSRLKQSRMCELIYCCTELCVQVIRAYVAATTDG